MQHYTETDVTFIDLGAFAASELDKDFTSSGDDDDDRDGHRNVGILRTPNAGDSPRRLYQMLLFLVSNLHQFQTTSNS
jgi:hypothetical protein